MTHLNCSRRLTHLSSWTHLTRTHVHTLMTAHNFAISTLHPRTLISMISSVSQLRHIHNHQRSPTPCGQPCRPPLDRSAEQQSLVASLVTAPSPPSCRHSAERQLPDPPCRRSNDSCPLLPFAAPSSNYIASSSSSLHQRLYCPSSLSLHQ